MNYDHNSFIYFRLFSALIESLQKVSLDTSYRQITPELIDELSKGFNYIFNPVTFKRRAYVQESHQLIGQVIYRSYKLSIPRPPDDHLRIIVRCCADNFYEKLNNKDPELVKQHVWNLVRATDTFFHWNVDPDNYRSLFWNSYFQNIKTNYSKLNQESSLLKYLSLRGILLNVLRFNKEIDFEIIKQFWQSKTLLRLNSFIPEDIKNIFAVAEDCGKFDSLADIVSNRILLEFKRRVQLRK